MTVNVEAKFYPLPAGEDVPEGCIEWCAADNSYFRSLAGVKRSVRAVNGTGSVDRITEVYYEETSEVCFAWVRLEVWNG